jgi:hypothetical protein
MHLVASTHRERGASDVAVLSVDEPPLDSHRFRKGPPACPRGKLLVRWSVAPHETDHGQRAGHGFDAPSPWVIVLSYYASSPPWTFVLPRPLSASPTAYEFATTPATCNKGLAGQSLRMQRDELRFASADTDSVVTCTLLSAVFPDERYDIDAFYGAANWLGGLFGHETSPSSPMRGTDAVSLTAMDPQSLTGTHVHLQIQQSTSSDWRTLCQLCQKCDFPHGRLES